MKFVFSVNWNFTGDEVVGYYLTFNAVVTFTTYPFSFSAVNCLFTPLKTIFKSLLLI
ncbi:MAG: hypothetical protein ACRDDY_09575 [Clostridium sp.]